MRDSQWRVPAVPLRRSLLFAGAFGALGVAALGIAGGRWLEAGPLYAVKAEVVFAAMMTAAFGRAGADHPFPRFGPANSVTTVRVMLVALAAGFVGEPDTRRIAWAGVGAAALAAALDGLDGWLARRGGTASGFGAWFDMETDALLIMVLSVLVWRHEKAAAWVLLCGLMRYAFVAAGWLVPWLARPLRSTYRGKAVAVGQMLGLGAALLPVIPWPRSAAVAAIALAALAWSFALDVIWLARTYRNAEGVT